MAQNEERLITRDDKQISKHSKKRKFTKFFLLIAFVLGVGTTFYFSFLSSTILPEPEVISKEGSISNFEVIKNILFQHPTESKNQVPVAIVEKPPVHEIKTQKCFNKKYVKQLVLISDLRSGVQENTDIAEIVKNLNNTIGISQDFQILMKQLNNCNYLQMDSYYALNQEFEELYKKLIINISPMSSNKNWFDKYLHKIIVIREIGDRALKIGGLEAQLVQAKIAMSNGNLQQAFDLISAFPVEQKKIISTWLEKASNRLKIVNISNRMYELITSTEYFNNFTMDCVDG